MKRRATTVVCSVEAPKRLAHHDSKAAVILLLQHQVYAYDVLWQNDPSNPFATSAKLKTIRSESSGRSDLGNLSVSITIFNFLYPGTSAKLLRRVALKAVGASQDVTSEASTTVHEPAGRSAKLSGIRALQASAN